MWPAKDPLLPNGRMTEQGQNLQPVIGKGDVFKTVITSNSREGRKTNISVKTNLV